MKSATQEKFDMFKEKLSKYKDLVLENEQTPTIKETLANL